MQKGIIIQTKDIPEEAKKILLEAALNVIADKESSVSPFGGDFLLVSDIAKSIREKKELPEEALGFLAEHTYDTLTFEAIIKHKNAYSNIIEKALSTRLAHELSNTSIHPVNSLLREVASSIQSLKEMVKRQDEEITNLKKLGRTTTS